MKKIMNSKRKGFTLIELIVVVSIIAILTMIAVPKFMDMTYKASLSTFEANHAVAVSAIQMYIVQNNGALPTTEVQIAGLIANSTGAANVAGISTIKGPGTAKYVWANGKLTSTWPEGKNTADQSRTFTP